MKTSSFSTFNEVLISYKPLIGVRVKITDTDSLYYGEYGVIVKEISLTTVRIALETGEYTDRDIDQLNKAG